MILLLTGTPGTGKTLVGKALSDRLGLELLEISDLVRKWKCYLDVEDDTYIVDIECLSKHLKGRDDYILVGHLSHLLELDADWVIVLRTNPKELEERLKSRRYPEDKIRDNLESEALGICSYEAREIYGEKVFEVDTSGKRPEEVVSEILDVIWGRRKGYYGIDYLEEYYGGEGNCSCS